MATNDDPPLDPRKPSDPNFSNSTLSISGSGAAAGQIGSYRLLQLLGEGGMGEVWLAEQKTPMHRTVAVKLIKAGMDTKAVVARFESERQALALMDHPNIAQVYDAGSTPEGRPYFAMEYVPGLPITEYCDKHCLTMKERVELFLQVCDAVQHAHQKAIIHRDLKPSNVLVVRQNDKPVPKIIDFGLAKAMAQRLTERTFFTEIGVLVGTPEYMSPEQADLIEQNVDTRTDVYSLGVILYELLVGALPFDAHTLRAAGLEAILRMIREVEPPKPSTKVRQMGESSAVSAEKRREEPRSFARHLQGELDWITLKALEKDRSRRYGTPSELAADLSRYLHDEPVVAGPTTTAYRIRKYASRHRFGLAMAAVALILLAGFATVQAFELHRTRLERDRANRERNRANRIAAFMTDIFRVSDPSQAKGNSITAREILDRASAQIDSSLTQDPDLQAQMMSVMGEVYSALGLYDSAQKCNERSLEIRQRVLGPESPQAIESMINIGKVLAQQGRFAEAEKLERQTLEIERRVLGPDDPRTLKTVTNLAVALYEEGHFSEAEKLNREALDLNRRVLGPENEITLNTMINIGADLERQDRYREAEDMERQTLAIVRRVLGPQHPDTLLAMNNLANLLHSEGRTAEAEKLYGETIEIENHVLGPEHQETLRSVANLGAVLFSEGRYADAEKQFRRVLDVQRRVLGPEHPETLRTAANLAAALGQEGHNAEAEKLDRETLAAERRNLGPEHRTTLRMMNNLGLVLDGEGRYGEAETQYRETIEMQRRVLGPDSLDILQTLDNLFATLMKRHDYAAAKAVMEEARGIRRRVLGPQNPDTAASTYNLGCVAAHQGDHREALSLLREAVDNGLSASNDLTMEKDPDLESLRRDPGFSALVVHAKDVATAAQNPK